MMVRLYRGMAAKAFAWLKVAQARANIEGKDDQQVLNEVIQEVLDREQIQDVVNTVGAAYPLPPLGEILDALRGQLLPTVERKDRDLIDTIVRILKLPNANQRMGAETIKALRAAILLPEELSKLKYEHLITQMCCLRCRRTLQQREMTTIIDGCIYCYACAPPSVVSYGEAEVMEVPQGTHTSIKRAATGKRRQALELAEEQARQAVAAMAAMATEAWDGPNNLQNPQGSGE